MEQINLQLEPGLLDRFKTLEEVVVSVVYSTTVQNQTIAMELDESPSSLSKKVKGKLDFPVKHLSQLMETTGDLRPLHWLIEKHLAPRKGQRAQALSKAMACLEGHPDAQQMVQILLDREIDQDAASDPGVAQLRRAGGGR